MTNIYTVGFEGLHRSGKGTQIDLLSKYLTDKKIIYEVIRGEGTRKGIGKEPYDSQSKWWQDNYSYFFQEDGSFEEKIKKRNLLYQRISRETDYYINRKIPKLLKNTGDDQAFLLMDRTFVSRFFAMRQLIPDIELYDALNSINPKNNKTVSPTIPHITFIFDTPKEILIERCNKLSDSPEKTQFRKRNIEQYYNLYKEITTELNKDPELNTHILKGNLSPEKIHSIIKDKLKI